MLSFMVAVAGGAAAVAGGAFLAYQLCDLAYAVACLVTGRAYRG